MWQREWCTGCSWPLGSEFCVQPLFIFTLNLKNPIKPKNLKWPTSAIGPLSWSNYQSNYRIRSQEIHSSINSKNRNQENRNHKKCPSLPSTVINSSNQQQPEPLDHFIILNRTMVHSTNSRIQNQEEATGCHQPTTNWVIIQSH